MTELPLVALGGLLGSAHCVGMCGGFAVSIGAGASTWRGNLARQLAYGVGRLFTYVALGTAAGYGGLRLISATTLFDVQAVLGVITGMLLILQGAASIGLFGYLRRKWNARRSASRTTSGSSMSTLPRSASKPACLQRGLMRSLLTTPDPSGPFLAGVLTGFLPCGLVYAMLALAAAGGSLAHGAAVMTAFGLGTLPVMTALGLGTSLAGMAWRVRLLRLAAWCVVLVGVMSVARGVSAWQGTGTKNSAETSPAPATPPACPLCK